MSYIYVYISQLPCASVSSASFSPSFARLVRCVLLLLISSLLFFIIQGSTFPPTRPDPTHSGPYFLASSLSLLLQPRSFQVSAMESAVSVKAAAATSSFSFSPSLRHQIPNPILDLNLRRTLLNFCSSRRKSALVPSFRAVNCVPSSSPDPVQPSSFKPTSLEPTPPLYAYSAVAFSPSQTTELVPFKLRKLVKEFLSLPEPVDRVKWILRYASLLPRMPESSRIDENRVMGCTARVWLDAELGQDGKMRFWADSDSDITRGLCSCLVTVLDAAAPEEVMGLKTEDLTALNVGLPGGERSRVNTWHNVLVSMQKRTRRLVAESEGKTPAFEAFPSLVVTADGIEAKGNYAEAQVRSVFRNLQFKF